MDERAVIESTRRWIADVVIGLNLCPFAGRVFEGSLIRYVVTDAADGASLVGPLTEELKALSGAPVSVVETTVLIHPRALLDFLDYNDFLDVADRLVDRLGLRGVIQIASFHPEYRFADTASEDAENYTNRSPYPMLHLLREESITAVAGNPGELERIPQRNIETMRRLGAGRLAELLRALAAHGRPS